MEYARCHNIDTSSEDMASECREAVSQGYTAYKTKDRPWFDLRRQMDTAAKVVPEPLKIDRDFNDTLLDAKHAWFPTMAARLGECWCVKQPADR